LGSRNAGIAGGKRVSGIKLSRRVNKANPFSAEYDVEDGDLQISVYVEKDGHFGEVILKPEDGSLRGPKRFRAESFAI